MSSYLKNGLPVIPDEYFLIGGAPASGVSDDSVLEFPTCTGPARQSDLVLPARVVADRRERLVNDWIVGVLLFLYFLALVAAGAYIGVQLERGHRYAREADAIDARLAKETIHE